MDKLRALVIGGSVSGLFVANLLRTIGCDVTVFERAGGELAGRGAGLGIHEELFAVMRRIDIHADESIGVEVRSRIALDRQMLVQSIFNDVMASAAFSDLAPTGCARRSWPPDSIRTRSLPRPFE